MLEVSSGHAKNQLSRERNKAWVTVTLIIGDGSRPLKLTQPHRHLLDSRRDQLFQRGLAQGGSDPTPYPLFTGLHGSLKGLWMRGLGPMSCVNFKKWLCCMSLSLF